MCRSSNGDIEVRAAAWLAHMDRKNQPDASHSMFEVWCRADPRHLVAYLRLRLELSELCEPASRRPVDPPHRVAIVGRKSSASAPRAMRSEMDLRATYTRSSICAAMIGVERLAVPYSPRRKASTPTVRGARTAPVGCIPSIRPRRRSLPSPTASPHAAISGTGPTPLTCRPIEPLGTSGSDSSQNTRPRCIYNSETTSRIGSPISHRRGNP
ncbi:MAG: FecR/PupR family sigma factor regulator [Steroidobacteraceae bacterium]